MDLARWVVICNMQICARTSLADRRQQPDNVQLLLMHVLIVPPCTFMDLAA